MRTCVKRDLEIGLVRSKRDLLTLGYLRAHVSKECVKRDLVRSKGDLLTLGYRLTATFLWRKMTKIACVENILVRGGVENTLTRGR